MVQEYLFISKNSYISYFITLSLFLHNMCLNFFDSHKFCSCPINVSAVWSLVDFISIFYHNFSFPSHAPFWSAIFSLLSIIVIMKHMKKNEGCNKSFCNKHILVIIIIYILRGKNCRSKGGIGIKENLHLNSHKSTCSVSLTLPPALR